MKESQEQLARFKADPKNQMIDTQPVISVFLLFCLAILGTTVFEDIMGIQFAVPRKYLSALLIAVCAFAGRKMAWARVRKMEDANTSLHGSTESRASASSSAP